MNVILNAMLQVLGVVIAFGTQYATTLPEKWRGVVAGLVALATGIVGIIAHFYNPDGTKAESEWQK